MKLTVMSTLMYVLAFNLTFFIQELFLVLPKALTPGLQPTLFHNNHIWKGANPLASLFQGTGALATLVSGGVCAMLLGCGRGWPLAQRLFLFWMAYSGVFMALPQVVIGALSDQSDIGMAMRYFGLGTTSKTCAALAALALIPLAAVWLGSLLLGRLGGPALSASTRERQQFVCGAATLPALLALPLIILFRLPREWIEVLLVPAVVSVVGVVWIQAGAWRAGGKAAGDNPVAGSLAPPLAAVLSLLLIFQVLLRPGIRFY
ncbi:MULTISPECIES: hypothetical protein [unclassified Duganella]|uniref:hypothetical protein n=1 Tax=unclassified Duganella TaxID=2636909 RepID=UPI001A918138|nr:MULTISPECIES: hypothetical protein [unclassified Duganella]